MQCQYSITESVKCRQISLTNSNEPVNLNDCVIVSCKISQTADGIWQKVCEKPWSPRNNSHICQCKRVFVPVSLTTFNEFGEFEKVSIRVLNHQIKLDCLKKNAFQRHHFLLLHSKTKMQHLDDTRNTPCLKN